MQNLSDYSTGLILTCLKRHPINLDLFRRTCKRMNDQTCSTGCHKIDDASVSLTSAYRSWFNETEDGQLPKPLYSIQSTVSIETPCPSNCHQCRLRRYPPPPLSPMQMIHFEAPQRDVPEYQEPYREIPRPLEPVTIALKDEDLLWDMNLAIDQGAEKPSQFRSCQENGRTFSVLAIKRIIITELLSEEYFIRRFEDLLSRIRSVGVLTLSGMKIGRTIMQYLTNHAKLKYNTARIYCPTPQKTTKTSFFSFLP